MRVAIYTFHLTGATIYSFMRDRVLRTIKYSRCAAEALCENGTLAIMHSISRSYTCTHYIVYTLHAHMLACRVIFRFPKRCTASSLTIHGSRRRKLSC